MLTTTHFKEIINDYKNKTDHINATTFHDYMVNITLSNDLHNHNINKIKGDIFEHLAKYYYLSRGHETYLFSEIPLKKIRIR